jgi:hypothetical protein
MIKQTSRSIDTVKIFMEFKARLGPVLAIDHQSILYILNSVGKTALIIVGTVFAITFHPLFAELSLVILMRLTW